MREERGRVAVRLGAEEDPAVHEDVLVVRLVQDREGGFLVFQDQDGLQRAGETSQEPVVGVRAGEARTDDQFDLVLVRIGEFLVIAVAVGVGVQDFAGGVLKRGTDDQVGRTRIDGLAVVAAEGVHLREERAEIGERQGVGRDVVDRARAVLAAAVVEAGAVDPVRRVHQGLGEEGVPELFARLAHGGDERAVDAPVVRLF